MSAVVTAKNLHKQYKNFHAVQGIDFEIPEGSCFGFLGPNGAGKTTTMGMILGFSPMSDGELHVFGASMPEEAKRIRPRMGLVPQNDNLDPDFTVEENLMMYGYYFGISKADMQKRTDELLKFASLEDRRNAKIDSLSGGMKRRLIIARALVSEPELVVLDEPTTALDPQARHVIWARLAELKAQGKTLILTTHYMEEAERLCDELVIMDGGKILAQGSPKKLINEHVEPEVIELRSAPDEALKLAREHSEVRLEEHGTSAYLYTRNADAVINDLRELPKVSYAHRPTGLEDVFLKLTGRELRD